MFRQNVACHIIKLFCRDSRLSGITNRLVHRGDALARDLHLLEVFSGLD